jgi:hypothetical protein
LDLLSAAIACLPLLIFTFHTFRTIRLPPILKEGEVHQHFSYKLDDEKQADKSNKKAQ